MSVETHRPDMEHGRALLTERERDALRGDGSDSYRYKTRTYLRSRLEELATDAELLAEREPELYQELRAAVEAADGRGADTPDTASDDAGDEHADRVEPEQQETSDVWPVVERVAGDEWDDTPERLEQRERAAQAVLEYAEEHGTISKKTAQAEVEPEYPVHNQSKRTWWRKSVRPVLAEAATYDNAARGYRLDEELPTHE